MCFLIVSILMGGSRIFFMIVLMRLGGRASQSF